MRRLHKNLDLVNVARTKHQSEPSIRMLPADVRSHVTVGSVYLFFFLRGPEGLWLGARVAQ